MKKFEKNIKDAVESFEAPYNAEAWQSLNKAMGPSKATIIRWVVSSAALIALAVFGYSNLNAPDEILKDDLIAETVQNKESKVFIKKIENSVYDDKGQIIEANSTKSEKDLKLTSGTETNEEPVVVIDDPTVESPTEIQINSEEVSPNEKGNTVPINENKTEQNTITVIELKAEITPSNTTQCISYEFTFTPSVSKQNAIYEWHLGDGTIINANSVHYTYEVPGNYSVELVLRDLKSKEILKTSQPVEVTVLEEPRTSFTYENSKTIEPYTYFENTTPNTNSLYWEIENVKSSNSENFDYSFKHKGRFTVNLTATNQLGCSTKTSQIIEVQQDYNLLAPTAFSPNGDNLNDEFMPKALPLMELPFTLTIYDRQGKLVYQTTDSSQPWDGKYTQEGIPAPVGVYVWVCQLTKENSETEVYQSQIIITK